MSKYSMRTAGRRAAVWRMRKSSGTPIPEIARTLKISERTVMRDLSRPEPTADELRGLERAAGQCVCPPPAEFKRRAPLPEIRPGMRRSVTVFSR